ncbi:MAG TPA: SDR family oxidoreductase [Caulobacteraceae bacterium]
MSSRLALITGASAGIGAAFARIYAAHGYDVALTARRVDRLEALADELRLRHGVGAIIIPADLADPGAPDALVSQVAAHGRSIDALINNAGYGIAASYAETSWEDQRAFIQVMLSAVCELTHKVLPGMLERRFGRIVNVASLAGLLPGSAHTGLYGPTKAFLVKFSQGLHLETAAAGVHVCALCPGFTYSEFHEANQLPARDQIPAWLWQGADEVAAAGYEAAEANRALCVPGAQNKAIAALMRFIPDEWVMALISRRAGRAAQN